jgi:hypothetical protein
MTPQYIKIDKDGDKYYFKDKQMKIRHREDGPAVEYTDGSKAWLINGNLHREDGPAVEFTDGHKEWHINGERHREDGPAIEWTSGVKSWYLNGMCLSEEKFLKRTAPEIVLTLDEIAAKLGIDVSKLKIVK